MCMVIGGILLVISAVLVFPSGGYSLVLALPGACLIACGSAFEHNLKWKAYMLYTNLNKNIK